MKVFLLLPTSVPEGLEKSTTLVLDTIRVGFPTAEIVQGKGPTHFDWIRENIRTGEGKMVFIDGDMIFWENVEDWEFPTTLAGLHVPMMWNDFAKCISMPRLHTSFLWVKDAETLREEIEAAYPLSFMESGEYCPCDPVSPRIQFHNGHPIFWDTCANLYHMIGGTSFDEKQILSYEHLNSASFSKVMRERIGNPHGFDILHKELVYTPEKLRGFSTIVDAYYKDRYLKGVAEAQRIGFLNQMPKLIPQCAPTVPETAEVSI